jgi:hypothetical protein
MLPEADASSIAREYARQLGACEATLAAVWESRPSDAQIRTPIQFILASILGRSMLTYRAVLHLYRGGYAANALMLTRSLFEDLVVGWWSAMPENHADAYQRLIAFDEWQGMSMNDAVRAHPHLFPDIEPEDYSDLDARRSEFKNLFRGGLFIGRNIWHALEDISTNWVQRGGDPRALKFYYLAMQRFANERLHITARAIHEQTSGTQLGRFDYGAAPGPDVTHGALTLYASAFCLANLAFVVLEECECDTGPLGEPREWANRTLARLIDG